jgi:hypothetical protein
LTEAERYAIYEALLERSVLGRLKKNTTARVSNATCLVESEGVPCPRNTGGC